MKSVSTRLSSLLHVFNIIMMRFSSVLICEICNFVLDTEEQNFMQMQYGSIGWAVGAALGYAAGVRGKKRLILSVGDGSFQVTAQASL